MGIIEKSRKFKRTTEQTIPTNPRGHLDTNLNQFDIDELTIKRQQNKH